MIAMIVVFSIFILFQFLGLFGCFRENFCSTCSYVILQFGTTVAIFILITFYGTTLWAASSWSLFVLIFALIYLRDLYLIYIDKEHHQQQQAQFTIETTESGGQNCTIDNNEVFY